MSKIFSHASAFDQNLQNWDTSNVTDMGSMFAFTDNFNGQVGSWDVSNVEYFNFMFEYTKSFNQPMPYWQTSATHSGPDMGNMFYNAAVFNQDLSTWCVDKIPAEPTYFSERADAWSAPKPVWGTCPVN